MIFVAGVTSRNHHWRWSDETLMRVVVLLLLWLLLQLMTLHRIRLLRRLGIIMGLIVLLWLLLLLLRLLLLLLICGGTSFLFRIELSSLHADVPVG